MLIRSKTFALLLNYYNKRDALTHDEIYLDELLCEVLDTTQAKRKWDCSGRTSAKTGRKN